MGQSGNSSQDHTDGLKNAAAKGWNIAGKVCKSQILKD